MYELREGRKMKPKTFASMLSNMLYERRYERPKSQNIQINKLFDWNFLKNRLICFVYRFGPFFVEPIVAGLDPVTKEGYIYCMDLIGAITEPLDFVVGGTAEEQLLGIATIITSKAIVVTCDVVNAQPN
jgi:20S proteasome subunit beta 3